MGARAPFSCKEVIVSAKVIINGGGLALMAVRTSPLVSAIILVDSTPPIANQSKPHIALDKGGFVQNFVQSPGR